MEIERKYLLKQFPSNLDSYASKKIAQGYLCTSPVVRVRRSNDSYYMTYKGAGLMVREEYNLPLTKEAYDHLVQKIDGRLIEKTRYLKLLPVPKFMQSNCSICEICAPL